MSFHSKRATSRRRLVSVLGGIAMAIVISQACSRTAVAGLLTVVAPNVTATAGETASFDVLLVNNDSTSYNIAGDAFTLTLSPSTGVTFTDATTLTLTQYVYKASSDVDLGVPLYDSLPGTSFTAADTIDLPYTSQKVDPGATFGLGRITFTVDPGVAAGTVFQLNLTPFVDFPEALNGPGPDFPSFPYDVVNGSITIVSVPEPSSMVMLCTGAVAGLVVAGRRTRRGSRCCTASEQTV